MVDFVVVAAFSDEAHIITEWLDHYFAEGARHIYLIDNASKDGSADRIKKHPHFESKITYVSEPSKKVSQKIMINTHFGPYKNEAKWVLVADIDDFVFASGTSGTDTIHTFLNKFLPENKEVSQILVPVRMFGSSKHVQQPDSVRQSFIDHQPYSDRNQIRSLVDASRVLQYGIGSHVTYDGKCVLSNGMPLVMSTTVNMTLYPADGFALHANRYAVQSFDVFMNIKVPRGGIDPATGRHRMTIDTFANFNSQCTLQNKDMVVKYFPSK